MPLQLQGLCPLIQVFDMPRSLKFYRDLLGFEVVNRSGAGDQCDWVLLRQGQAELMLNTMYELGSRPGKPPAARIAAHRDTGLFIATPDIDGVYAHLCASGVSAKEPVVRDYGMRQLYVKDPDGYELCFQWPLA